MNSSDTLFTPAYVDHVFSYIGHNYNPNEAFAHLTLYGLNELARKNRLVLCRRQLSNRDVRILIQNNSDTNNNSITENSLKINESKNGVTSNSATNRRNSEKIDINKNYKKFLFNFNKIAVACYLSALNAPDDLWSMYNIPLQLAKDTNFYVIESSPTTNERHIRKLLEDTEFINNYMTKLYEAHNKIANLLYKNLNTPKQRINNSFYSNNSYKSNQHADDTDNDIDDTSESYYQTQDKHLFRSFRILGLRHRIHNKNEQIKLDPFSEIVEIRCSFDIKQFENKKSYDCFIECELSYYKVANAVDVSLIRESVPTINGKWLNYLNNHLERINNDDGDNDDDDVVIDESELNDNDSDSRYKSNNKKRTHKLKHIKT